MSCNCDIQITDINNRITGINSDISNIYSQTNSNYNVSNVIIQNYANIENTNITNFSNTTISNITSLSGNILISSDYTFANSFVRISNIYGNIVIHNSTDNGTLNLNGNANIQGNINMGNYTNTYQMRAFKYKGDYTSSYNNNQIYSFGKPQQNYVSTSPWVTIHQSSSFGVQSVCWAPSLGIFCAVNTNAVYTSSNGISWTSRTPASSNSWYSICWSESLKLFCAVSTTGNGNRVMTSPDGITWTSRTSAADVYWASVCWAEELSIFCAISNSSAEAMISSDGINWSLISLPASNGWYSLCWSPELKLFCAVGRSGSNRVMTSSNGTSWSLQTSSAQNEWLSVTWASQLGLFCAVSFNSPGIMTSPNGIDWTNQTIPENNDWQSLVWCSDLQLFMTVASNGSNRLMTSTNGINWIARYIPQQTWSTICWSTELGIFCAGNQDTTRIPFIISQSLYTYNPYISYSSSNITIDSNKLFINNSTRRVGIGNTNPLNDLDVYGNVIIGNGTKDVLLRNNFFRTYDFYTNNNGDFNISQTATKDLIFQGGATLKQLLKIGIGGFNTSSYILDGFAHFYKNFEYNNSNLSYNSNITIGSNTLIIDAVGGKVGIGNLSTNASNVLNIVGNANINGNLSIYPSFSNVNYANVLLTNGTFVTPYYNTQTPVYGVPQRDYVLNSTVSFPTYPNTNTWYAIAWSPQLGLFCSVSQSGTGNRVMTSPDGITWTTRTSAADNQWLNIIWISELFLFVAISTNGTGNRVMTSPNGITWTTRTSAADNSWYGITWSPELKLIVVVGSSGSGNRIMTSPDGITWTTRTSPSDIQWRAVAWSSELGLFAAVSASGINNRIMTSIDGINWTIRTSPADIAWRSVVWSPQLRIFCACADEATTNSIMTSPDGINWTLQTTPSQQLHNVIWCPEIRTFVAVARTGTNNRILTSYDGITWTNRTTPVDKNWLWSAWSGELGIFVSVSFDATTQCVMRSQSMYAYNPYFDSIRGNLAVDSNVLFVNSISGNVGILTSTPRGNLEVVGNAAKTGGGNWSTSSDARVKEYIQDANIDRSYEIVKNLDLKYYQYDENTIPYQYDKHTLGWLAQDVETYFPKSILEANMYGYEDFKLLDYDLLLKSMYGALEKVIDDIEKLEVIVDNNQKIIDKLNIS